MALANLPLFLKPILEILIAIIYFFIFNTFYKIIIQNIYETMQESIASDYYSLLNITNYILLFIIGVFFILLNNQINSYFFIALEFLIFILLIIYGKSSLSLMDRFIFLLFRPENLDKLDYYSFVGSIEYKLDIQNNNSKKNMKKRYNFTFKHLFANIEFIFNLYL